MTFLTIWLNDPTWLWIGIAVSFCGHVYGAIALKTCRDANVKQAKRLDDLENGTTHRLMRRFCDEMTARLTHEQTRSEALLAKLDAANKAGERLLDAAAARR